MSEVRTKNPTPSSSRIPVFVRPTPYKNRHGEFYVRGRGRQAFQLGGLSRPSFRGGSGHRHVQIWSNSRVGSAKS